MNYKILFFACLSILILLLCFIAGKRLYYTGLNKKLVHHFYLDNPNYRVAREMFTAYTSKCDIAFIGDSHVGRCAWNELLDTAVCNMGIGSDVTEGIYRRVDDIILKCPKVCFISSGANDVDFNIPPDTTVYYYMLILDKLKKAGIRPVIMLCPLAGENYPEDFNNRIKELNNRLKEFGEHISIDTSAEDLQADGIHLTAAGYLKWKTAILRILN